MSGQRHTPAALPPEKTRYPLYRRLGGLQSRCGRAQKLSPSPGFDLRTVQPVASRYTDWAILAHNRNEYQEYSQGGKAAVCYGWLTYQLNAPIVLKSGSLETLQPSGFVQACNGIALPSHFLTL